MQKGPKAVRAQFLDASAQLAARVALPDPDPDLPRTIDGEEWLPGQWPGHPRDRLPPGCPVVPLGVDGKTCYYVDTQGQLQAIAASEWNQNQLNMLFMDAPNFLFWAWPRFAAPSKKRTTPIINGLEKNDAVQCLMKAAADRGLFDPADKVRGRGAWTDRQGAIIWHSGEHLFRIERGRMQMSKPGDVDGMFYARRPSVITPWPAEISDEDSPAHELLGVFNTWTWERPILDPLLMLGWIGCALLGGALPWRPTIFVTGDRGRGKSTLQAIVKAILGNTLHASADTTAAGIYQRVKQDSLPVAVDELEGDDDNRKVIAVIKLARLASSGAEMFRGGAEHEGVQFRARNAFFFSSINTPPLGPQDRSRMAILSLGKVDPSRAAAARVENPEVMGRQILRRLMDQWTDFDRCFNDWRSVLRQAGFDGRGQDTYGVLLAVANQLLGAAGIEAAGLPITETGQLGALLADATASERAEQTDNWVDCLDRTMSWTIDNWKGGDRPIVGDVLDRLVDGKLDYDIARSMLMQAGLGLKREPTGRMLLAIPPKGVSVAKIYAGTKWASGTWMHALKQGPVDVILRGPESGFVVWIAGRAERCVLVDVKQLQQRQPD